MSEKKKTQLLSAYLIVGENALKREAAIKRLRMRLEKMGDLAFNSDEFQAESASGDDIMSACKTIPFASEKRLVIVNDAEKLKKSDSEAIVEYLKDPLDTTVLACVCEKLPKTSVLYKTISKAGATSVIECALPKKRDLPTHVMEMAKSHGVGITPKAANKLIECIGEDTIHLDNELNKLALVVGRSKDIDDKDIARHVAQITEAKPWEYVDAFSARDIKECIRLMQIMPSVSAHALLGMCLSRIRELICVRTLLRSGRSTSSDIASALGVPDWKVKKHALWAKGFSAEELRGALSSAMDTERKMKSGTDPDTAFLEWTLSVLKR